MAQTQTHWKKLTNPDYLGAYSLEPGKDVILTIKLVRNEQVIGADGKKDECMVCHWLENEKPMIVNATNAKQIAKNLGTPYIEQWAGRKVQIGVERVKAFGDVVEALRVRKFNPKETVIKCEDCGQPIKPSNGMTPEQVAAYTKKNCGKAICMDCARKIAEQNATGGDNK